MTQSRGKYPVWDAPVRVSHWYLSLAVGVMWLTGEQGYMDVHQWTGYSVLCVVTARIIWGFVGGQHARFINFVVSPAQVLCYMREGGHFVGHNPLGALSVVAMLLLLFVQAVTGLFSRDDLMFEGPLAYWAGSASGRLTEWHETNWLILQAVIALHLLAVAWHQWRKRQPMIQAMWYGSAGHKHAVAAPGSVWPAVLILGVMALALWGVVSLAPEAPSYY